MNDTQDIHQKWNYLFIIRHQSSSSIEETKEIKVTNIITKVPYANSLKLFGGYTEYGK
jgi:hypothetical protein